MLRNEVIECDDHFVYAESLISFGELVSKETSIRIQNVFLAIANMHHSWSVHPQSAAFYFMAVKCGF